MRVLSVLEDERIKANNILFEVRIGEYLSIAKEIINRNEFQRNRVGRSYTIYSLLKTDLKQGCMIPAIILALGEKGDLQTFSYSTGLNIESVEPNLLFKCKEQLLILDGLQRTYTMFDVEKELINEKQTDLLAKFYDRLVRIELYIGINRLGILYRMLTLNTGQTPMSLRHQVEIMYVDYLDKEIDGIRLIREVDENNYNYVGVYKFKDAIEGFNSYLERDELPVDRYDLLENIRGLEKLAKENPNKDLFKEYIQSYHKFVLLMNDFGKEWIFDDENNDLLLFGPPFAKTVNKFFDKSQAMTGFGAAIGKLVDNNIISGFDELMILIEKIQLGDEARGVFENFLEKLDKIRVQSKKIGNSQRMFFQYFFRELFNKEGESFLLVNLSIDNAFRKYQSQVA